MKSRERTPNAGAPVRWSASFGGFAYALWPTINSDKSTTEGSELGWFAGLRVDLSLPAVC